MVKHELRVKCKHCGVRFYSSHLCPKTNKSIYANQTENIVKESNTQDDSNFGTSMVMGMALNNGIVGGMLGGNMIGGMCGDIMNDGKLF